MEEATTSIPVEVDPTVINDKPNVDMLNLLEQMSGWNRAQRRNFIRAMGGFKKCGRKW